MATANTFFPGAGFSSAASLSGLFNPRSVVFIDQENSPLAQQTLRALTTSGFSKQMFYVGNSKSKDLPTSVYPTIGAMPMNIDLAIVAASPSSAPEVIADCVAKKVRGVVLLSDGFGTPQSTRTESAARMQSILRGSRTRVIGPTALGIMNPLTGLNAAPGLPMPLGGTVAFVSESATLGRFVLEWSLKQIVGFSAFACLGSMLDVTWANIIDYFGTDPNTKTIAIQMSSVGNARSLISAAREVSLDKPIIVMKIGRDASIRAIGRESASMASDDAVLSAAFRRVGVLEVDSLEDLFYAADALSKQPRPAGGRLMVVSNSESAGVMAADAAVRSGVELAEPAPETRAQLQELLPGGEGADASFAEAVTVAENDQNCDGLLLLLVPSAFKDLEAVSHDLLSRQSEAEKPILISFLASGDSPAVQQTLLRASFPIFSSPATAARVFQYMRRYSYELESLYETPVLHAGQQGSEIASRVHDALHSARAAGRATLSSAEAESVAQNYGISISKQIVDGSSSGWYKAKFGSRIDAQFGPVLMFGAADRGAGNYGDLAIGLPPLNATLARHMLEQSAFFKVLQSECGAPAIEQLETALVDFSELVAEQALLDSVQLHLLVGANEVLATAIRCALNAEETESLLPKPAIRPYPRQYISTWTMKNGQEVTIRPIRAEDEPLMVRFHQTLSDRSVYLRYFQKLKLSTRTSHDRLVRVCFLDYDREFALLAERNELSIGQREVIAIATLTKIPYKNDGEVAVLISDAYHGQGLGKELIARIVGIARDEGLGSVSATTMVQNEGMCAVFERLGFRITIEPEDQLVEAKLLL